MPSSLRWAAATMSLSALSCPANATASLLPSGSVLASVVATAVSVQRSQVQVEHEYKLLKHSKPHCYCTDNANAITMLEYQSTAAVLARQPCSPVPIEPQPKITTQTHVRHHQDIHNLLTTPPSTNANAPFSADPPQHQDPIALALQRLKTALPHALDGQVPLDYYAKDALLENKVHHINVRGTRAIKVGI